MTMELPKEKKDYGYTSAPIDVDVYEQVKKISDDTGKRINRLMTELVLKGLESMRQENKDE